MLMAARSICQQGQRKELEDFTPKLQGLLARIDHKEYVLSLERELERHGLDLNTFRLQRDQSEFILNWHARY